MTNKPVPKKTRDVRGYGVFMALGPLVGLGIGIAFGEPSAGAVGGLIIGTIAAVIFWLSGR